MTTIPRTRRVIVAMLATVAVMVAEQVPAWAAPFDTRPERTWSADGRVRAIVRAGDRIFIGGDFTQLIAPNGSTVARKHLAALDASSGAPLSGWVAHTDRPVHALAVTPDGTRLLAGGGFSKVDGTRRVRLAALSVGTGDLTSWSPAANGLVRTVAIGNGRVYVGGNFSSVNGTSRTRLAAVDLSSGALASWSPRADKTVNDLTLTTDGARVVIAGDFDKLSGTTRHYLGSVDAADGSLDAWTPKPECVRDKNTCRLLDVVVDSSTVYAAVAGPGGRLTAWPLSSNTRRWNIRADGDVQAVALHGGLVYAGGHFYKRFGKDSNGNDIVRRRLAAANTSGKVDPFDPNVKGNLGVWAIQADDAHLRIGGDFTAVSGVDQVRYAQFPGSGGG